MIENNTNLTGKRLVIENKQTSRTQYEIIIFDYVLSAHAYSKCNLGVIKTTKDLVAIKTIQNKRSNKDPSNAYKFKERYERELKIFYQASRKFKVNFKMDEHSNIVDVYPLSIISKNNTHAYIVMQFCQDGNLEVELSVRRLNFKWFTFGQFYNLVKQFLNGYNQLYESQILHQDLRPSNILLNDKYIKISNFSLSQKLNDIQTLYHFLGSPYYSAPEMFQPNYTPSYMSDIYSLGVIFFQLIFDQHPYCKQVQFRSTLNKRTSLKPNQYETNRHFCKKVLNQVMGNEINLCQSPMITFSTSQRQKQQENLQKIIKIVVRMLTKEKQKRISLQEIMLEMQKIVLQNVEPLEFMNNRCIPKNFTQIVRKQSSVSIGNLHFKDFSLKKLETTNPKLYIIRYNCERINILSNLLYGVMSTIQKQIKDKQIKDKQIIEFAKKLLQFNYVVTYTKYNQILNEIAMLDRQTLMEFYSIGLDSIVNNTKYNQELLEDNLLESANTKQVAEKLTQTCYEDAFKQMSIFINKSFRRSRSCLDPQNVDSYMLVLLIIYLIDLGPQPTLEEMNDLRQKQKNIYLAIGNYKTQDAAKELERSGIIFAIQQLDDQ